MALRYPYPRSPTSSQDETQFLENEAPIESNACKDVTKEKTFALQAVSPLSSGEGLPYAPEGWPNPGDVWGWKVGKRTNKAGYFRDRSLYLPRSLQNSSCKAERLQSKPDVKRYIESNFPDMEIEEFFALFSWEVPSTKRTRTKAAQSLPITPPVKSLETGEEIGTKRKLKQKMQTCSQPTRKSFRLVCDRPRLAPDQDANDIMDICPGISDSEEGSGMQKAGEKNPSVTVKEKFDGYVDTLEDMLVMPHTKTKPSEADHVASATTQVNTETVDKSLTLVIQNIDDQIRQLESRRNQISSALEIMYKSKAELASKLTNLAASVPAPSV